MVIYFGTDPTSSGDFKVVQIIEGAGVVETDTVQGLGTDAALLYDSGVKSLQQIVGKTNLNLDDLSEKIDPDLTTTIASGVNYSSAHYPKLGWYLLLVDDVVRIYSYKKGRKSWSRMVGADVNGMFTTSDGKLYLCGTGFLYEYNRG